MAIASLQNSAPEQAIPMIEKLLQGNASPKLKERARFLLAQSNSAQARAVLKNIAQGRLPLGMQTNDAALVALARKEPDAVPKREIVTRLSHSRSKIATDYMLEILSDK